MRKNNANRNPCIVINTRFLTRTRQIFKILHISKSAMFLDNDTVSIGFVAGSVGSHGGKFEPGYHLGLIMLAMDVMRMKYRLIKCVDYGSNVRDNCTGCLVNRLYRGDIDVSLSFPRLGPTPSRIEHLDFTTSTVGFITMAMVFNREAVHCNQQYRWWKVFGAPVWIVLVSMGIFANVARDRRWFWYPCMVLASYVALSQALFAGSVLNWLIHKYDLMEYDTAAGLKPLVDNRFTVVLYRTSYYVDEVAYQSNTADWMRHRLV